LCSGVQNVIMRKVLFSTSKKLEVKVKSFHCILKDCQREAPPIMRLNPITDHLKIKL